ncbi:glycerol kinase GlpK [Microbacterium sp. zg.Y1090]|uniref:glycerol kinase GlpK n=1 Tax=Microbacterium TaxID=33882 RepID=UPI00214AE5A1|nr:MULTISPECIES: glycerol kinase GlpK [unclassified Microbacterium]MCR2813665.1 glycerol kinase GlpK [Microbacterium sp. zg.Y1084]MCR2818002.1 glycerol kinase GlpK [Microbacterium sp. zg.Y1090]MDL5488080.1 glycerol kinase GlpK [Microbacterium sp. zg-Y1211]WIM29773.1 glycerol kinase GlpK [Microbacterium sp. zg-Y1090]
MADHVIAIDQGTTSTRAIVFDSAGSIVATAQREHEQIFPRAGWVEHDPVEIWTNTEWVLSSAVARAGLAASEVAAIGITNQRETTMLWDRRTGRPIANAIVWQDTRTQRRIDELAAQSDAGGLRFAEQTGLPLATYFSASKIAWILDAVPGARAAAEAGEVLFGTPDTWVIWNLTGGSRGGIHVTDVTNASRTLLMDLRTLDWSDELLAVWDIPRAMLPEIRSSSQVVGEVAVPGVARGVPIAGILGDQQAATFGQAAFGAGESKNTYGTGNFLLVNTGDELVRSQHGLITTVAYRRGDEPAHYALEGSIAVTGSLVQWLRDNLGIIARSQDVETLAATVDNAGGAYFVPAFSGLFAPYWRPDARGALVGMTRYVTRAHIARAALESTAFQTRDIVEAVVADTGAPLTELRVDGGMTRNDLLMQFQADILGIPVVRPRIVETTALGAAYAAGLATGVWADEDELRQQWREDARFEPRMDRDESERRYRLWRKAVTKSFDWVDEDARILMGTDQ